MKKIIITTGCASGEAWQAVLDISVPRFKKYAERHDYDFKAIWYNDIDAKLFPEFWDANRFDVGAINNDQRRDFIRWTRSRNMLAPNWLRYAAVIQLLKQYDVVLYFDADCVLADFETDLSKELQGEKWLATPLCSPSPGEAAPGTLWVTRSCDQSKDFWWKVWCGQLWKVHPLWTDGVDFMDMLGYSTIPPVHKVRATEYDKSFVALSGEWGVYFVQNPQARGKCYHVAGGLPAISKATLMQTLIEERGI